MCGPACDWECSNSVCSQKETDGRLKLREHLIYKGINYKGLGKIWGALDKGQSPGLCVPFGLKNN